MLIDLHDRGLSKQLHLYGTREDKLATIFEQEVEKISSQVDSPLIVEAGANIGYYTILESNAIGGQGQIIGIEPSKSNINLLQRNIRLNNCDDLTSIHHCALDSTNGNAELQISEQSNLHRLENTASTNDQSESESVTTWRLDDFLIDHEYDLASVNVIRMDIEGAEMNALRGMLETLNESGPTLLFLEVHNHILTSAQAKELPQTLSNAGFEICAVENASTISTPFSLTIDVGSWDELSDIPDAYGLIAKKQA
jgi:FkbM family methyltransferase